jgi:hypothetical protein
VVWRPIERALEGDFWLRLSSDERELLRRLPAELRSLLDGDPDDPSLRRLFPPAHEDDAEAEAGYQRLMRDELLAGRREALRALEGTVDRERLREEELHAWVAALNDLRLVFGTRLRVTNESCEGDLDPRHPRAHEKAVYAYLTCLQEELVGAIATEPA